MLDLLEAVGQCEAPVRELVGRAGHIRALVPAYSRLDQAQVLADDKGPLPPALVGEQREQVCGGVLHVSALGGSQSFRDPVQAKETHHVVEPHTGGVTRRAADGVDEWRPVRIAQLPRIESGDAPVLAVAEELVWRGTDAYARSQVVPPAPGVETIRCETDRHVVDQPDLARGASELLVDMKLQPLVVREALGVQMADVSRPIPPGSAVNLADRVEGREVSQRGSLEAHVCGEPFRFWRHAKDSPEYL